MLRSVSRNWWVLMVRGIFAVLFGLTAFALPAISLFALVVLYGAYALLDGVTAVVLGLAARGEGFASSAKRWWAMVLVGSLGIAAGVVTFVWPGVTALVLLVIIAVTAIVRGIAEIAAAIRLHKVIEHEWLLGFAGAISVAFGLILIARPAIGALAVVFWIGAWAIVFGVASIAQSLRLRSHWHRLSGQGGQRPAVGVA